MILTIEEAVEKFTDKKMFRSINSGGQFGLVAVSGGFDPLHFSHVRYLKGASDFFGCDDNQFDYGGVVVIVNGDGFLTRKKGKPFMKLEERMEIIDALECVDWVVPWDDGSQTVCGALELLKPDIFAKGGDRNAAENVPEFEVCQRIGCRVEFGVGGFEKGQSSSSLLANWEKK